MARPTYPWQRHISESALAFNAFTIYRDLGAGRSYSKVRLKMEKGAGYQRQIEKWAREFEWVKRATLYDDHMDNKKLELATKELEELQQYAIARAKEVIDELIEINLGKWCEPQQIKSYELYFKLIGLTSK